MQLLTNKGTEGGDNPGLGLLDAETTKLKVKNLKLPHIGWNSVSYNHESRMFKNISDKSDFYFLHSYALKKLLMLRLWALAHMVKNLFLQLS